MRTEGRPSASVIVAVNPHDYDFSVVLDGWANQACAGAYEVVVAHDGRRRELEAEVTAHLARHPESPVRCVKVDAVGRGALNNAGVRASRGDLLIFSADDSRAPPGFIAAHRAFHDQAERPGVGVGPIWFMRALRDDPFRRWLEDSGELFGSPLSQGAVVWQPEFFFVGNASLRRALFDEVGGFDERFPFDMHEDFLFGRALRSAGHRFTPIPRAYGLHDHALDFGERKDVMRRLGATSALLGGAYAHLARVQVRNASGLVAVRERESSSGAAAAGSGSYADWRRHWSAGLDRAYAEGLVEAGRVPGVTPPSSAG